VEITTGELRTLCTAAVLRAGGDQVTAAALADATVRAERRGKTAVGASHLPDYLDALESGAIDGTAVPSVSRQGSVVGVDAHGGTAQRAFDAALQELSDAVECSGVGVLTIGNSYTCGEVGDYTARLADLGMVALAAANSPANTALGTSGEPVIGTNPLSFAAPADGPPLLIDQAVSSAAYVSIRRAADQGRDIPDGWAVDGAGDPTTDARAALAGALLPDGGHRMGNIGLIVEVLAGLAGGLWSLDAPSFLDGGKSPATGLFVLALDPARFGTCGTGGFSRRLTSHVNRLESRYGVHIPGRSTASGVAPDCTVTLSSDVFARLNR
jgi:(2R)-3-sulfolactate dehydrogenase (NADP+)